MATHKPDCICVECEDARAVGVKFWNLLSTSTQKNLLNAVTPDEARTYLRFLGVSFLGDGGRWRA